MSRWILPVSFLFALSACGGGGGGGGGNQPAQVPDSTVRFVHAIPDGPQLGLYYRPASDAGVSAASGSEIAFATAAQARPVAGAPVAGTARGNVAAYLPALACPNSGFCGAPFGQETVAFEDGIDYLAIGFGTYDGDARELALVEWNEAEDLPGTHVDLLMFHANSIRRSAPLALHILDETAAPSLASVVVSTDFGQAATAQVAVSGAVRVVVTSDTAGLDVFYDSGLQTLPPGGSLALVIIDDPVHQGTMAVFVPRDEPAQRVANSLAPVELRAINALQADDPVIFDVEGDTAFFEQTAAFTALPQTANGTQVNRGVVTAARSVSPQGLLGIAILDQLTNVKSASNPFVAAPGSEFLVVAIGDNAGSSGSVGRLAFASDRRTQAGVARLRVVHVGRDIGEVDIYEVTPGSDINAGITCPPGGVGFCISVPFANPSITGLGNSAQTAYQLRTPGEIDLVIADGTTFFPNRNELARTTVELQAGETYTVILRTEGMAGARAMLLNESAAPALILPLF